MPGNVGWQRLNDPGLDAYCGRSSVIECGEAEISLRDFTHRQQSQSLKPQQYSNQFFKSVDPGSLSLKMVYTIVVHLYAKDSPTDIEKLKNKLVEASRVYSKDRETIGWHVMQDHQDPRAFTIVERYERESVSSPLVNFSVDFFVCGLIDADIDAFHRARSIILRYVEERLKFAALEHVTKQNSWV